MTDFKQDPFKTVGNRDLCAWAVAENECRIQTRQPTIAAKLAKLPDCRRVGYSVAGGYLRIYHMPYTLQWVGREVVQKLWADFATDKTTPVFPGKKRAVGPKINCGKPEEVFRCPARGGAS